MSAQQNITHGPAQSIDPGVAAIEFPTDLIDPATVEAFEEEFAQQVHLPVPESERALSPSPVVAPSIVSSRAEEIEGDILSIKNRISNGPESIDARISATETALGEIKSLIAEMMKRMDRLANDEKKSRTALSQDLTNHCGRIESSVLDLRLEINEHSTELEAFKRALRETEKAPQAVIARQEELKKEIQDSAAELNKRAQRERAEIIRASTHRTNVQMEYEPEL